MYPFFLVQNFLRKAYPNKYLIV